MVGTIEKALRRTFTSVVENGILRIFPLTNHGDYGIMVLHLAVNQMKMVQSHLVTLWKASELVRKLFAKQSP